MSVAIVPMSEDDSLEKRLEARSAQGRNNRPKPLAITDLTPERAAAFWRLVDMSAGPKACWPMSKCPTCGTHVFEPGEPAAVEAAGHVSVMVSREAVEALRKWSAIMKRIDAGPSADDWAHLHHAAHAACCLLAAQIKPDGE